MRIFQANRLLSGILGGICLAIHALFGVASGFAAEEKTVDLAALKAKYKRPDTIPFPKTNPYTPEKAALGKMLYFDPRVSKAQNMTCASCHNPSFGWEAPVDRAIGAQNTPLGRHAPTVLNQAWGEKHYFWDGRASTLEEQAKGPIEADVEMNMPLDELVSRLKGVKDYVYWFDRVFPNEGINEDTIAKAIATYERTVIATYSPFDRWLAGDETAISESAKRGFKVYNNEARCADCHSGWNFTDNKFHDIGLESDDIGRGKYEPDNKTAKHAFKTPGLRDLTQRMPFMHDGSLADLEEVIAHYVTGGISRPSLSPLMQPLFLSEQQTADLITFLKTLTGKKDIVALPILPN